ncbi:MAG: hypothetical protein K2J49_09000, partial [Muribaculaceae bacterium]|nr:hypothetical protein [Muribaculaceae bacterium]
MAENNDLFQFDDFSGTDDRNDNYMDTSTESSQSESGTTVAEEPEADIDSIPQDNGSSDAGNYDDNAIQHLDWNEHIRRRPGMYIGKLGDGTHAEDGIYV